MFDVKPLIDIFDSYYYTLLIMGIAELTTIIIALHYRQKNNLWKAFLIYLFIDMLILMSDYLLYCLPSVTSAFRIKYFNYSNTIVAMTELTCYYFFYSKILTKPNYKWLLKTLWITYTLIFAMYMLGILGLHSERITYLTDFLGSVEFMLILPFCLIHYRQLLTTKDQLSTDPKFWITTGIFFYCMFSIPGYLLSDYIRLNHITWINEYGAIFYFIPMTINFTFLAKAFSCKKTLTIS